MDSSRLKKNLNPRPVQDHGHFNHVYLLINSSVLIIKNVIVSFSKMCHWYCTLHEKNYVHYRYKLRSNDEQILQQKIGQWG